MSLDSTHTMRRGGRDASLCVARGPVFPAVLDSRAQHDSPIPGEGRLEQEAAARYENTLRVVALPFSRTRRQGITVEASRCAPATRMPTSILLFAATYSKKNSIHSLWPKKSTFLIALGHKLRSVHAPD